MSAGAALLSPPQHPVPTKDTMMVHEEGAVWVERVPETARHHCRTFEMAIGL